MPNETAHIDKIQIKVGGADLPTTMMNLLYLAEVENTLYLPSMFTLRFHDDDFTMMDNSLFALGAQIEISMGSAKDPQSTVIFKGEITALEPEFSDDSVAVFVLRGYDVRHRLQKAHTQTFLNVTDSDIVKKLLQAAGIQVGKVEATTVVREHLFQDNQIDLALIQSLAQRNGYELTVTEAGKLDFCKPSTAAAIDLKWRENLRSFRPRLSLAEQVGSVEVRSWDRLQKKAIVTTATPDAHVPKIGGQALAAAKGSVYSASKFTETNVPVENQTEAQNLATALATQIGVGFAEAEGLAFGNAALKPGVRVKIGNIGTRFGGEYTLSSTRHVYSAYDGYDTQFTIEGTRPQQVSDLVAGTAERPTTWQGVVPAIVTDTVDPKKMNRVKVKFPTLNDTHTSTWAPLVAPGAGADRGIQWLPEVNDEVLVAFEAGDINHPYVLGGLWNGKDAPPDKAAVSAGKTSIRIMKTRVGHVLRMADEDSGAIKKGIQIIDSSASNKIIIDTTTKKITIESAGDIEVKSTTNMTFTATGNVEIKGMAVKVEAQSTLDLKATGPANLKGAVVNIN